MEIEMAMAEGVGGLMILDGSQLRSGGGVFSELSLLPLLASPLLEVAETRTSVHLYGVVLPQTLKSSALRRIGISDAAAFSSKDLDHDTASSTLINYISAIADELDDNPLVAAVLDGTILRSFLDDEDDFAMLAENLFTDLDTQDKGKIPKHHIQNALPNIMGIQMGIPPVSEFPQFSDILKKHGAEGKELLGQAQFAQLLQPVLQEVADTLAKKHVVIVQNIKVTNGSKIRKLLADDNLLEDIVKKIVLENSESGKEQSSTKKVRSFLEKHGEGLGLPPLRVDETLILFDEVFREVDDVQHDRAESEKDEIIGVLKKIVGAFAEKLKANPVLYDPEY